jgi:hypothetical protein
MARKGVDMTFVYELTANQAALIEFGKLHPFGKLKEIQYQDGIPVKAEMYLADGTGTETVLFDKVARKLGLLKEEK